MTTIAGQGPVARLSGSREPRIENPNSGGLLPTSLGLPVSEVIWEGPVLRNVTEYCKALAEALSVPRTRVSNLTASLAPAIFDQGTHLHAVDALLDDVRNELDFTGFIGFRSLDRAQEIVNVKVVLIDAYWHPDQ